MPVPTKQLRATDAPQRLGESTWKAPDGQEFPYTRWMPKSGAKPDLVVIGVHGLSGAADDYRPLGQHFEAGESAVYSYELRGQGNDPVEKRRGDIRSPEEWFADLNAFVSLVRHEHPGTPLFLYGESLGSLIVSHGQAELSPDNKAAVAGIVLASPIVALPQKMPPIKNFLIHLLVKLTPWLRVSVEQLNGGEDIQVTADTTHESQMAQTPHFVKFFTLRLLGNIEKLILSNKAAAASIDKPLLVLYPGRDYFTGPADVDAFFDMLPNPDKEQHCFKDSFHLLLHDKQSADVLKTLDRWLAEKAAATP